MILSDPARAGFDSPVRKCFSLFLSFKNQSFFLSFYLFIFLSFIFSLFLLFQKVYELNAYQLYYNFLSKGMMGST